MKISSFQVKDVNKLDTQIQKFSSAIVKSRYM